VRNLGLKFSNDLKLSHHVANATKNAYYVLSKIRNTFTYFDSELVKLLYTSLIRPHLEFAIPVWNPYLKKDIDVLERVQHKITKLVPTLRNRQYDTRLERMSLIRHEKRRVRGDLIQFFKCINDIDQIIWFKNLIIRDRSNISGPAAGVRNSDLSYSRQLVKNCQIRENFFTNRVIDFWNDLPVSVKQAGSVNIFKARLDKLKYFSVI
jgi:hypothetical protein